MNKRQIEKRISLIPESVLNNSIIQDTEYLFLLKKTEKIILVTYIITDFIPSNERLKESLKDNSHDVLDSICQLWNDRGRRMESVQKVKSSFVKLLTQYNLAYISGFISNMNSKIIKDEINNLLRVVDDLERNLLDEESPEIKTNYFNVDVRNKRQYRVDNSQQSPHFAKATRDKKVKDRIMSYKKDTNVLNKALSSQVSNPESQISNSNDREEKVVSILKDKGQVSIRDISEVILDCSEKTIQRLLNKLIDDGKIIKKGERRWAKYELKNNV